MDTTEVTEGTAAAIPYGGLRGDEAGPTNGCGADPRTGQASVVERPALNTGGRRTFQPLSTLSQPELVERARAGDRRALNRLFEECAPIIAAEVGYRLGWIDEGEAHRVEDLYQEGRVAVCRALRNYDPGKARGRFRSYAAGYIRAQIRNLAIRLSLPESVGDHLIDNIGMLLEAERRAGGPDAELDGSAARGSELSQAGCEDGTVFAEGTQPEQVVAAAEAGCGTLMERGRGLARAEEDLATEYGISPQSLSERLGRLQEVFRRPRPVSLDTEIDPKPYDGEGASPLLRERLTVRVDEEPGARYEADHDRENWGLLSTATVHEAIAGLDSPERTAVVMRYGLGSTPPEGSAGIGRELGITEAGARTVLRRARARLAGKLATLAVRPCVETGPELGAVPAPDATDGEPQAGYGVGRHAFARSVPSPVRGGRAWGVALA